MTVARFEGTGPVARYWLGKCEGFAVTGGEHGVVEELIHDDDPYTTTRLVVRTRGRRRRVVPAAAIASVVPAERTLVVARPKKPPRQRRALPRARLAPVALQAGRVAAWTRPAAHAASTRLALLVPPARAHAERLVAATARFAARCADVLLASLRSLAGEARSTVSMVGRSARAPRRRR